MLDLEFAEISDIGPTRGNNEDCCGHFVPATPEAARSRGWCFAVADGVGGQEGGEVASRVAIETVLAGFPSVSSSEPLSAALPRILQKANQRVFEASAEAIGDGFRQGYRSGSIATTIVACGLRHDRATVAHVGDSRCYLVRRGEATALTRDHTVAGEQARLGILTGRQAASASTANLLTRCLGAEMFVNVDWSEHLLAAGDVLLLCSDGLHHSVKPSDMAAAVHSGADLKAAAAQLVSLANARDGSDNVTVQIIRVKAVESVGMYRGRLYRLPSARNP